MTMSTRYNKRRTTYNHEQGGQYVVTPIGARSASVKRNQQKITDDFVDACRKIELRRTTYNHGQGGQYLMKTNQQKVMDAFVDACRKMNNYSITELPQFHNNIPNSSQSNNGTRLAAGPADRPSANTRAKTKNINALMSAYVDAWRIEDEKRHDNNNGRNGRNASRGSNRRNGSRGSNGRNGNNSNGSRVTPNANGSRSQRLRRSSWNR